MAFVISKYYSSNAAANSEKNKTTKLKFFPNTKRFIRCYILILITLVYTVYMRSPKCFNRY